MCIARMTKRALELYTHTHTHTHTHTKENKKKKELGGGGKDGRTISASGSKGVECANILRRWISHHGIGCAQKVREHAVRG